MNGNLQHHGILGMKWGIRRTPEQLGRRAEKKDVKWANKNHDKIYKKAYKPIQKELDRYRKTELNPRYREQILSGKISKSYANEYNRKLAELMNTTAKDIAAPSGRVVQFVAKRGEMGVHMALADRGYDMSQLKNGVYSSGKIAYKKKNVNMA